MTILHVIASADPKIGGPIEGIKQLGKINTARGHRIEVASIDSPDAAFLKDFPLPIYPLGPGFGGFQFSRHLAPWLRQNTDKYDVVIVNGIWQYNGFAVWRALQGSKIPYVVVTHGMLDPWFKHAYPLKHLKKWLYWPWGQYRVLRDAEAVLFTSEEERILARKSFWLYSAKERVINYGTASPAGNRDDQTEEFFEHYPHLRKKRLLLFMGRIHPKKACDLALQAFASTLSAHPTWHLVMAGPDQIGWRPSLESLAARLAVSDRVTWTGMITGNLKIGAMRSAEAFFLPSHSENFGIVVAEALSCGLPVLISDKVNIWREIQFDGAGLVAPDTAEGASSLLAQWTQLDEKEKLDMSARARTCFETRFEINQASTTLIDTLRQLCALREGQLAV